MTGHERTSLRLTSCLVGATLALTQWLYVPVAVSATVRPPATIKLSPDHTGLWVDGFIDDDAVAIVEQVLGEGAVTDLYIRSIGGYVVAGLRLGELVRDGALCVHVVGYCGSSCANYVFTAGRERSINGFVVWHGSVEQKDLREAYLCGRLESSLFGHAWPPFAPEERTKAVAEWTALRARQEHFFASIGENEYITRAGQEPVNLAGEFASGSYTYDIPTLRRFGVEHIQAVEGYGTEAWCSTINKDATRSIGCLRVSDDMLEFDRVRKERGEECQPA